MGINAGALACWFKTTDNKSGRQSLVFGRGSGVFVIDMVRGGRIEVVVRDRRGRDGLVLQSAPGLADDQWHHAWKLPYRPFEWMANVRDVDGDGKIEFFASGIKDGKHFLFRYDREGRTVWTSEAVNPPLGIETAAPIYPDLDGNGKAEVLLLDDHDTGGYIVLMDTP